jgi:hypothetical protein
VPEGRWCRTATIPNGRKGSGVPRPSCAPTATRTRTYCLGGNPETWPDIARYGLTCHLAAAIMAGCGLMWPCACGRWLPVWLPGDLVVSSANVRMIRTPCRPMREYRCDLTRLRWEASGRTVPRSALSGVHTPTTLDNAGNSARRVKPEARWVGNAREVHSDCRAELCPPTRAAPGRGPCLAALFLPRADGRSGSPARRAAGSRVPSAPGNAAYARRSGPSRHGCLQLLGLDGHVSVRAAG